MRGLGRGCMRVPGFNNNTGFTHKRSRFLRQLCEIYQDLFPTTTACIITLNIFFPISFSRPIEMKRPNLTFKSSY